MKLTATSPFSDRSVRVLNSHTLAIACMASARLSQRYLLFNRTFSSQIKTTTGLKKSPIVKPGGFS